MATKFNNENQILALWKQTSKDGNSFLSSKEYVGFYNSNKKNPKEPDLRVYKKDENGKIGKESLLDMWCNPTKDGKGKYLTGKISGRKVVGFITKEWTEESKKPYLSVYYSDEVETKAAPKQEAPKKPKQNALF